MKNPYFPPTQLAGEVFPLSLWFHTSLIPKSGLFKLGQKETREQSEPPEGLFVHSPQFTLMTVRMVGRTLGCYGPEAVIGGAWERALREPADSPGRVKAWGPWSTESPRL